MKFQLNWSPLYLTVFSEEVVIGQSLIWGRGDVLKGLIPLKFTNFLNLELPHVCAQLWPVRFYSSMVQNA